MLLRFIHTTCIWTTSCTTSSVCLSKAFQRTCFRFESGCKGKTDFRNHQIFRKVFFGKNFHRRFGAYFPFRPCPFSLPCDVQGKILGEAPSRNPPAYTLSSEFHPFNAFPSRKRLQRYTLSTKAQVLYNTFLKHFFMIHIKGLIIWKIRTGMTCTGRKRKNGLFKFVIYFA